MIGLKLQEGNLKEMAKLSKQDFLIDLRLQIRSGILGTSWRCWMLIISSGGLWQYDFLSTLDCPFWGFHPRALFFFFFLFFDYSIMHLKIQNSFKTGDWFKKMIVAKGKGYNLIGYKGFLFPFFFQERALQFKYPYLIEMDFQST